ncbi:nucleoside phosphatase GDA1/CD39 [Mycena sp. CBHHK59/15]|nr:nucleoside phosphatase GDA1/CD39 [Mycena sp. CBHHK59/15]
MLDAGSTGSRIHIYKFNNCGPAPAYEYEVFEETQPGLSEYAGRPDAAAASLDPLMAAALRVVPTDLHKCTPVAVKATAGLRLLPGAQVVDILQAVEGRLKGEYPFALPGEGGVVVMDGTDEGVFAWITANYLLGSIGREGGAGAKAEMVPTYAVLDLGGASTQIVFEPAFATPDDALVAGEHKYDLEFGGKKRVLYQHSYLGFGLMKARSHVHRLVAFTAGLREPAGTVIANPCLARGTRRAIDLPAASSSAASDAVESVTMDGGAVGGFAACARVVDLVLAKDAVCPVVPCAFAGVYQPALLDAFPAASGRVLLLSYFYDRLAPLLPAAAAGGAIAVDAIAEVAGDVCKGRAAWEARWGAGVGKGKAEEEKAEALLAELDGRPEWCLDLTFMHALLRRGYEFEGAREVVLGKRIAGTELGWCLGAGIALVGADLSCRI